MVVGKGQWVMVVMGNSWFVVVVGGEGNRWGHGWLWGIVVMVGGGWVGGGVVDRLVMADGVDRW